MRKYTFILGLVIPFVFSFSMLHAQCTPGNEQSCPDPENNGQICPDTVAPVIIGSEYHQEITMLPPSEIDTFSITAELYYIKLVSIEGLPDGIEWVTNTDDNIFQAGIYYCILFSGTSNAEEGIYPIKIEVNLYVNLFNDTLEVPGIIDSTSIAMQVMQDPNSIGKNMASGFVSNIWPNPFQRQLNIELLPSITGQVEMKVYNLLGQKILDQVFLSGNAGGTLRVDAEYLPEGMYFVAITNRNKTFTHLVSKSQ